MTGFTFICFISLFSYIQAAFCPGPFSIDFFLIAAVYISLASNRESVLFTVWGLGIVKGIFSCSPFSVSAVSGFSYEPLTALYTFPPLAFTGIYILLSFLRERLMNEHPFTQFLIVVVISTGYGFSGVLLNQPVPLAERVFMYWGHIILTAVINGAAAVILFRLLSRIPIRAVQDTERGDF